MQKPGKPGVGSLICRTDFVTPQKCPSPKPSPFSKNSNRRVGIFGKDFVFCFGWGLLFGGKESVLFTATGTRRARPRNAGVERKSNAQNARCFFLCCDCITAGAAGLQYPERETKPFQKTQKNPCSKFFEKGGARGGENFFLKKFSPPRGLGLSLPPISPPEKR